MMSLIRAQNIKKEIAERQLFHIEELVIHEKSRIGLVGVNGSGKTTLLSILSGETEPDSGHLERNTSVRLLPQLKRTNTTKSGGEVTAEYIIQALNESVQVLLADEPTTHLDTKHVEWVEKEFQVFRGAFVVISHDREFLDHICDTIWELKDGGLTVYSGNYPQYVSEKEKEREQQQTKYEEYVKKAKQLEEAKKKREQHASNIEGESKHFYFRKKAKKMNKTAKSLEKRVEQLEKVDKPEKVNTVKMELVNMDAIRNRFIVRGFDVSGNVANKQLWEAADFTLKGGEKAALIGDNGSGKTTLLRKILHGAEGVTVSPAAKIGYFAQNLSVLNTEQTILDNVKEGSKQTETLIRIVLAQLQFKGEDVYKKVAVLSGGERVKVSLAKIIVGDYNTLILDEPTNFLDIQAVEALETLLKEYEGSLILVSHDRRFLSEVTDKCWIIEEKKLIEFNATYDEWIKSIDETATSMNEWQEKLLRIENEITSVLGQLSINPSEELDKDFQELVKEKKFIQKKMDES